MYQTLGVSPHGIELAANSDNAPRYSSRVELIYHRPPHFPLTAKPAKVKMEQANKKRKSRVMLSAARTLFVVMKSAVQIRAQVEAALDKRISAPFSLRKSTMPEMVSTGLEAVDALTGGVPRGSLTEVSGPPSSGRTALELALLSSLTAKGEACSLIDAEDGFDPMSAQAAGVQLERLLWVRCGGLAQALRATDLVLGAGGFGAVVLDLAGIPARWSRRVPLGYWFRFRRAVENTPTVLLLIDEEPCAGSSASLGLRLEREGAVWSGSQKPKIETRKSKLETRDSELRKPLYQADLLPHARLLRGIRWRAEVVRNRNSKIEIRNSKFVAAHDVHEQDQKDHEFRVSSFEFRVSKSNRQ